MREPGKGRERKGREGKGRERKGNRRQGERIFDKRKLSVSRVQTRTAAYKRKYFQWGLLNMLKIIDAEAINNPR